MKELSGKTKILLCCGIIGAILFVFLFSVEGALRLNYNSFRYPVSSLSIGYSGWIQISNFITSGLLMIAFAVGVKRTLHFYKSSGALLIGLVGVGLVGAGFFSTDPVYGYPESEPLALAQFTLRGHLHDLFSMLVFICLPCACLVFRKYFLTLSQLRWARYSAFTAIGVLVTFFLAGIGFKQISFLVNFAGLFQRLSIIIGCLWTGVFALYLLKFNTKKKQIDTITKN